MTRLLWLDLVRENEPYAIVLPIPLGDGNAGEFMVTQGAGDRMPHRLCDFLVGCIPIG
jgi:hypothetical protein